MRIERISVAGFRGFREPVTVPLAHAFTVVDGRNGVGKSTLFDAVEYVLTGQIGKYENAKAAGETVDDYIWWKGEGTPSERFVEVAFRGDGDPITLRRTPISGPDAEALAAVEAGMVDVRIAPPTPLPQLCATAIIRDESIAKLSLDLTETQRYSKLREAIGATDADRWIGRAERLVALTKSRNAQAREEIDDANDAVVAASLKVDEVRAMIPPDAAVAEAAATMSRLLQFRPASPDQLLSPSREFVSLGRSNVDRLGALLLQWEQFAADRANLDRDDAAITAAKEAIEESQLARALLPDPEELDETGPSKVLVAQLHQLISLGTRVGLLEAHCPLCAAPHDAASFAAGLAHAADLAKEIDAKASQIAEEAARRRAAIHDADLHIAEVQRALADLSLEAAARRSGVDRWHLVLKAAGLAPSAKREEAEVTFARIKNELETAEHGLRILETLGANRQLDTAMLALDEARGRLSRAQNRAGLARRAETSAHALHDAARRAGLETLDLRLQRVLPLMAELYRRLRPHPVWQDIEYLIRGDVRRFLSLQVGRGLNPQFLFSSGQRRATGLAFLLSINLSLAWSRWNTILLDDPVQHVDDFRAVNLAEVLAQLVASGRQVVVAVEDEGLAELLARRMPVAVPGDALRITLGLGPDGSSRIIQQRDQVPMQARVLAA